MIQAIPHAPAYVLITAAYNEEGNIHNTIESVLAQTLLPAMWVIVSDGSVDRTDEIVQGFAEKHEFMRFLRLQRSPGRSFGFKVAALKAGNQLIDNKSFEYIGNLDADVTVDPKYFRSLITCFEADPSLGLAGGFVCEDFGLGFQSRPSNRTHSVAHAAQLVRRKCYEQIGGYAILEYGGEDWHAQTCARMNGWKAIAIPELNIYHHRHTGEADNLLRHRFRQGRMDYSLGSAFPFEVLKCVERMRERPLVLGGVARLSGFLWSILHRDIRPVSTDFMNFLRREQAEKVSLLFRGGWREDGLRDRR